MLLQGQDPFKPDGALEQKSVPDWWCNGRKMTHVWASFQLQILPFLFLLFFVLSFSPTCLHASMTGFSLKDIERPWVPFIHIALQVCVGRVVCQISRKSNSSSGSSRLYTALVFAMVIMNHRVADISGWWDQRKYAEQFQGVLRHNCKNAFFAATKPHRSRIHWFPCKVTPG